MNNVFGTSTEGGNFNYFESPQNVIKTNCFSFKEFSPFKQTENKIIQNSSVKLKDFKHNFDRLNHDNQVCINSQSFFSGSNCKFDTSPIQMLKNANFFDF